MLQACHEEVIDPATNIRRPPDTTIFITPYPTAMSTSDKYHQLSKELKRERIEFIDGNKLADLIQKHLPEFYKFLDDEKRYKNKMAIDLNKMPEIRHALGLKEDLYLDQIFVDVYLDSAKGFLEDLAVLQLDVAKPKIVIADPPNIGKLKKCASWWGCDVEIIDPPVPTDKSEEDLIGQLQWRIDSRHEKIVKIRIESLLSNMQLQIRSMLTNFSKKAKENNQIECKKIVKEIIEKKQMLLRFRDNPIIWNNWLTFVKKENPVWAKPSIQISPNILLQLECNHYITGGPGTGKTTLLRRLAKDEFEKSDKNLIVYLPLVYVQEKTVQGLIGACLQELVSQGYTKTQKGSLEEKFLDKAKKGELTLFLDGLDEIGSKAKKVGNVISKFAKEYPNCRIVLSCRDNSEIESIHNALELSLRPFSNHQVNQFINNWFADQPNLRIGLKKWLKLNPTMRSIARNPLISALLCSLYNEGVDMPTTEVELYEERFNLLIKKWDQAKGIQYLSADLVKRYWRYITELAFAMHTNQKKFISINQALDLAKKYYSSNYHREPIRLVMDCIQRGILSVEWSNILSFGHLTYQEYLAARMVVMENDLDFIAKRTKLGWWRKTLEFYAGMKEDISPLIEYVLAEKEYHILSSTSNLLGIAKFAPWTDEFHVSELVKLVESLGGDVTSQHYADAINGIGDPEYDEAVMKELYEGSKIRDAIHEVNKQFKIDMGKLFEDEYTEIEAYYDSLLED